jgi:hypothetical protein
MKNKLHRFLGLHDWSYGEKYQTTYTTEQFDSMKGKYVEGVKAYRIKQDRTCKICGKIEVKTIDS